MAGIRVGVLGVGRIGRLHTDHLATRVPGASVTAISDLDLDAAREVADRLRVPRVLGDPVALCSSPEIDAVVICTSTNTHADFIEAAAAAGKHIFCEKPIDLDLGRGRQTIPENYDKDIHYELVAASEIIPEMVDQKLFYSCMVDMVQQPFTIFR